MQLIFTLMWKDLRQSALVMPWWQKNWGAEDGILMPKRLKRDFPFPRGEPSLIVR
jgi:hypothetical protein